MGRQIASRAALLMMLAQDVIDFRRLTTDVANDSPAHQPTFSFTSNEEGCFAVVFANGAGLTPGIAVSAGGWTTTNPGVWDLDSGSSYDLRIFSKVLTAGDVSSGLELNGCATADGLEGAATLWIARGPTSLSVKSNTNSADAATTLTIPAFTPAANSEGALAFVIDQTGAGWSAPTTPARNIRLAPTVIGAASFSVVDWAPSDYDGAAKAFTGFDATKRQNGIMLELLP